MKIKGIMSLLVVSLLLTGVSLVGAQEEAVNFTVTIENISAPELVKTSGVFNTPVDATEPGPALPGAAYGFSFPAEPGDRLSFATMYVQSNDLFLAPAQDGIALFDDAGEPITGDITGDVLLWDAGTEVNEEPGVGENQAPRQAGPDTGDDENGVVTVVDDGFDYGAVADIAAIELAFADGEFTVTITNISEDSVVPTPFAPGVFAVHSTGAPLFVDGAPDFGMGLEALAEDGAAGGLGDLLAGERLGTPLAPGVFAVHSADVALFAEGEADLGIGMEPLAEDGAAAALGEAVAGLDAVSESAVFNTPVGADEPGPALPGAAYSFSFSAQPGDLLSFATMFVQSNDLFYAPEAAGLPLFDEDGTPLSGTITGSILLWDAGTEVNEEPGVGENQAPRQAGPDTGDDENGVVTVVDDGFSYPNVFNVIRVTITAE